MSRLLRGLLAPVVVLALGACGSGDPEPDRAEGSGVELVLRAYDRSGAAASRAEVIRATEILEGRLRGLGARGSVSAGPEGRVVVRLLGSASAGRERVVEALTRSGELEFFDFEANLVPPSIDASGAFPVATDSLYDLLVGRQSPAREDDVRSWYLFDTSKSRAAGPAPTKQLLLANGTVLDGWRILGVPPGTAVLECGTGETVCPGVDVYEPRRDFYYLVRFDPPRAPELDGSDLELEGTRQEFDTTTGEPIVTIQFTESGGNTFAEIAERLALRGRRQYSLSGSGDPIAYFQHFAIVLDRRIKSWPSIDFEQYPKGIGVSAGAQITGIGDPDEAKTLAAVLQAGALPVRLETVSRRPLD